VPVDCEPTGNTGLGGSCSVSTTANALSPGMIPEGDRTVVGMGQIQVEDGGPDNLAATQDNSLFAVQGIFVP
jgi:hypothetical protein